MILALALLAADPAPRLAVPAEVTRCAPDRSVDSILCRALAAQGERRFADSAALFEEAATLGTADRRRARLWIGAGNMWIAAGEAGKAAAALDKGLADTGLDDHQRGEALIDRARAAEAAGDIAAARAKLAEAERHVAADPYLWFMSAALSLKAKDIPAARAAIARGLALAPSSSDLLLAAAEVESAAGNDAAVRDYLSRAKAAEPDSAAARNAAALLQLNEADKTKNETQQ